MDPHGAPLLALGFGSGELWLVLALALLFFGATRLPGIARSLGRSVNEFKGGLREGTAESPRGETPRADAPNADKN